MSVKHLLVDVSFLGPGTTGVKLYAIDLARFLERSFACKVLSPRYLAGEFVNSVECGDPIVIKNSVVARGHMSRAARSLVRSADTFVYCPYMQGFLGHPQQVITIHDLIAHRYPTRNFIERAWNRHVLPRIALGARAVFTVSKTARIDVARYYGLPIERVHVVPNALDLSKWVPGPAPATADEPYLLAVSANRVYKNTTELLLHHRLWADRYRLRLVSTRSRYGRVLRIAVRELGLEHRVDFLDGLSEQALIELYRGCAAVVYPSLMEGFGRPALEGMAVGRPVILSDIPVHRELFADAAIFITPGEPASWRRAFAELEVDAATLAARIDKGLAIAGRHTLTYTCGKLVDALLAVQPRLDNLRRQRLAADRPTLETSRLP